MATSPIIGVRLDPETIERLDEEAELRGHTRSSLARHLLKQQLVADRDTGALSGNGSATTAREPTR